MLNIAVPEVTLNSTGIDPSVCQIITTSVSKHVRMDIEIRQTCRLSVTLDEPVYHASRQWSTLLGNEQWTTTVGRHLLAFSQPVLDCLDLSSVKRVRRRYATFETVNKHVFLGEVNVRDFQSTGFRGSKA